MGTSTSEILVANKEIRKISEFFIREKPVQMGLSMLKAKQSYARHYAR